MKEEIHLSDILWGLMQVFTRHLSLWDWLIVGAIVLVVSALMISSIMWWYQKLK